MREKISAIIIANNEEKNIRECLESVNWCDEIILVDSESTDRTVEIAKEFTDKIFIKKWEGFAVQKRFSLEKASNEWVISVDADERVSPQLKNEIEKILDSNAQFDGFKIPRENYFLNKKIKYCGWGNDFQLRLFKKSKAKVTDRKVHEGFIVDGNVGKLDNALIHYTHQKISETINKINHYSTLEAEEKFGKKKVKPLQILTHPIAAFLNHFISRKGYKDGVHGLMISLIHAMTNMLTYMKLWEMQNKKSK
jgi:glycosyltransferase involved in cell wall biosynthesis